MTETCTTTEVTQDLDYWRHHERVSDELRGLLNNANVILAPESFRDLDDLVFPTGTTEFYQFLQEHSPADLHVEIAADDQQYRELALHADLVRIAQVVTEFIVAPVTATLVASYLWAWLGSRFAETNVRTSIVVDMKRKKYRIEYEGPAPAFESTVKNAIAQLGAAKQIDDPSLPPTSIAAEPEVLPPTPKEPK